MKFCRKCGTEIEEDKSFCTKCGSPLSYELEISNKDTTPKSQINIKQIYNNLNKKQKLLTIVVGVILIVGIVGFNVGASLTSKKSIVSKFTEAIVTKNSEQAAKYITSSDLKLKIEAKKLDNLLNYLDENPSYRNEIVKSIEEQSLKMDLKSVSKNNTYGSNSNDFFTLKKQGKAWIFFDKYVFEIKPSYIKVSTNYKDTEIYMEDELICTTDKQDFTKELGPYIPGKYNMKAVLKGEYVDLEKTSEVNLISSYDNTASVSLYLDGYTPTIECDYEDAKIFANGKDTGLQVKDAKKFRPVSKDGSVKLYAQREFPWGVAKGEEVAVNGYSTIKLKLSGVNDQIQESLMNTINSSNKSWCEAQRLRDSSKLTNLTGKMKNEEEEKIQQLIKNKQYYSGQIKKSVFDLDSMKIYMKDNKYYAEVKDKETYEGAFYYEGSTPSKSTDDVIWTYTLVYDDASKQWLLEDEKKGYSFSPDKKKEFNF